MRRANIRGQEVYLNEKQYESLLKRFDPKRFKDDKYYFGEAYKNDSQCKLCRDASKNALIRCDCPFGHLELFNVIGCFRALTSILTKYETNVMYNRFVFGDSSISFRGREETGKKILRKIHSAIKEGFKKVKKGKKK